MHLRAPTLEDADAIVAILVACDIADYGTPDYDRDELLAEWGLADDLERDAVVTDGAYGLILGTDIRAWVHPDRRGEGLGTALADELEPRMRDRGHPFADQQIPRSDAAGRELLERRGYEYLISYADLHLPDTAIAGLPASDAVRPYDAARDEQAVQSLIEDAFSGGAGRVDPLAALLERGADTSLWFVVDAPNGSVAAALRAELRPRGFLEGYVNQIATAPAHRGQGHAAALLATASRELASRGATGVRLHVRSSNPNALRLYERLGFQGAWSTDEYRLPLR